MNIQSEDYFRRGIIEAKAGDRDIARRYFDRAFSMLPSIHVHDPVDYRLMSEVWLYVSEVSDDPAEKRKALQNCLEYGEHEAQARRALAILDGKIKADEIINPNQIPAVPIEPRQVDAQRFICSNCGGRMVFAPDGSQKLVCEYCTREQALNQNQLANEKDFIVAMATARGHSQPLQEQVFHCQGCGAEFILPPNLISASCVYCDSTHVVNLEQAKDLLAPDGIIPYQFDQKRAIKFLVEWVEGNGIQPEKKVELPRGLYVPVWTFDIGGVVEYTYEYEDQYAQERFAEQFDQFYSGRKTRKVRATGLYPIEKDDLPVPASRKLADVFAKLIDSFEMQSIQPYDPRFLAGMPAEIYDIPMAEASLDARSQACKIDKMDLQNLLNMNHANIVSTSSANVLIQSFKLNLFPVWMTELPFGGREHLLLINGQNGVVASDIEASDPKTAGGLWNFISNLFA